jgi:hypothetical protein
MSLVRLGRADEAAAMWPAVEAAALGPAHAKDVEVQSALAEARDVMRSVSVQSPR